MSLVTKHGRISVKPFAKVPPLGGLSGIAPSSPTVSNVSSNHGAVEGKVEGVDILSEGCLVTKTLKYTHQLVHWISPVEKGDSEEVEYLEYLVEEELCIVPYSNFRVSDPCNLTFLEHFVHTSLDRYAFIAVTPSLSTLNGLIEMVRSDNQYRQVELDTEGINPPRSLDFSIPSVTNPEYELVAMYFEHFLPIGSVLPVYDPATGTHKTYVPARDRFLRESSDPNSPRMPAFYHTSEKRNKRHHLNVFFVALNAEIKFRRYLRAIQSDPPVVPLPDDVFDLMRFTKDLIDEIYWELKPGVGTVGEEMIAQSIALNRNSFGEEIEDEDIQMPGRRGIKKARWKPPWPDGADLETRKAYGRALMGGYDRDYDPELFEDPAPLDSPPHLHPDNPSVEAWREAVSSPDEADKPSEDAVTLVEG